MMRQRPYMLSFAALACALTLAGCGDPASREAKYLKRGVALFDKGDYAKAEVEFKNAARIKPTDPEIRYRLGLVYEAQGELRNAFGNFFQSVSQDGRYRPALLKVAQYYVGAGQYEDASERLKVVLADSPQDPQALALRGTIELRQGDVAAAESDARAALEKDPANVVATADLVGLYLDRGDEAAMAESLAQGIARNPSDLSLLRLKVAAYRKLRNVPKVIEAYGQIYKLQPKDRAFRGELAQYYLEQGRLDEAETALRDGVAAMPEDWEMKRLLVGFLSANRGLAATEAEIKGYIRQAPDNDSLYFWLADLYVKFKDVDGAVRLLQEVVANRHDQAPGLSAQTELARISVSRGDRDMATRLIAVVLEKSPENPDALLMRAGMDYDEGHYQSAVSELRTLLRSNPRSAEGLKLLAESLARQNHMDLAVDTMGKVVENDPANLDARIRLAQMRHLNGAEQDAFETIDVVTKAQPTYAVGWEATARIAIDVKDWPKAQAAIDKLASLPGQSAVAKYLRGRVAEGTGKVDEALRLYADLIKSAPTAPLTRYVLASYMTLSAQNDRLETSSHFLETLGEDSPLVVTALGDAYWSLGKEAAAEEAFDRVIAQKVGLSDAYIGRAELAMKRGDVARAIETLRAGGAAVPRDLAIPLRLAGLLSATGHFADAETIYDDLLIRDPSLDLAANNLAELIADHEYANPEALEKARRVAERFEGSPNPLLLDTLAWVYFKQGKDKQALTLMERAAHSGADLPPQLHYHYGALLAHMGQKDEARRQLQKAMAGSDAYPGRAEAKRILDSL